MRKKFDAVTFQRKAREELSKQYSTNREAFLRELKEQYGYLAKRGRRPPHIADNSAKRG
jgi:hypothetical protein